MMNYKNVYAEFLEELKNELKQKYKNIWAGVPYDDMYTGGREWELGEIINKIKQFEAEQKGSDENRN